MDYAFTHNAQQLTVRSLHRCANDLPVSLFSSESVKSLSLYRLKPAPTWDLPSLTTLYLDDVTFNGDEGIGHISKCANLKNLTLHRCYMSGAHIATVFDICLPELINLTLEEGMFFENGLNVFAPKLENLTVIDWETVHLQSISKLVSLVYKGFCSGLLQIFSFGLCYLEKVDICICNPCYKEEKIDDHNLVDLLRLIQNAKYITLNLDLIQLIFSFRELILHQPSPFANLKHLKVYPHYPFSSVQQTMPIEVKNYFLDSSPCATFTMVSYEEMKAVEHATSAQKYMVDLQMLLEQEKIKCETNKAHINWSNASMEENMNEQGETQIDEEKLVKHEMSRIRKYWKAISARIDQGEVSIGRIFFALAVIESPLKKLPAPTYDRIQERFSSLRAEAYNVIKLIMDGMKIKCDGKQGCSSVCLHELTTP
ncbi:uncharacterized protein [Rutidosis leptorrhynchoides]|uniref:uncharacterized protein n=1 Tax=Rutidosis leptorrhynchoides TaxID=125765 RepID=UPI003A99C10A